MQIYDFFCNNKWEKHNNFVNNHRSNELTRIFVETHGRAS